MTIHEHVAGDAWGDRSDTANRSGSTDRTGADGDPARRVRHALRANALFSTVSGVSALFFGGWIAEQLGVRDHETIVRLLGAALVGFAALVAFEAKAVPKRLLASTLQIAIGDLGWVVGSAALIALGTFSTRGNVLVAVVALVVLDFAIWQLVTRHRALAVTRSAPTQGRAVGTI